MLALLAGMLDYRTGLSVVCNPVAGDRDANLAQAGIVAFPPVQHAVELEPDFSGDYTILWHCLLFALT